MAFTLTRFRIEGLHGKWDIDIPIRDNKLILVGVNGLGKTTVVNILYFLITEQWARLSEFEFTAVGLELNGEYLEVTREEFAEIEDFKESIKLTRPRGYFPAPLVNRLVEHPNFHELLSSWLQVTPNRPSDEFRRLLSRVSDELGVSPSTLQRVIRDLRPNSQGDLFTYPPSVSRIRDAVRASGEYQVVYLPTYRRIEQDLKAIFPDLEDEQLRDLTARRRRNGLTSSKGFVELVQFGMKDVEQLLNAELETIRESARTQLTNLTASYLRDVIRNDADKFDQDVINSLDTETIRNVLQRVEENTLNARDKRELESAIERIRRSRGGVGERDKYLAHFFSKLLEIHHNLFEKEQGIQELTDICNRYLEGKRLDYNDTDYTILVRGEDDDEINFRHLSSGEKQIVSLFTHLLLGRKSSQFVIIDEPELSLSVVWQETLLPDISALGNVKLLIAVTHSPFIYANELDPYAVDLAKHQVYRG